MTVSARTKPGRIIALCSAAIVLLMAVLACGRQREPSVNLDLLKTPNVYPTTSETTGASSCAVKDIRLLALGGENSWSPSGELIVFQRRDDSGVYQLYTIRPDGTDEKCISCTVASGGPSMDRHKGFAAWHPSGEYLVTQVEMERHSMFKRLTESGRGLANNLWVLTADGQQWFQLTDYSPNGPAAILNPRFSPDGSKLLWSEKIGRVTREKPLGEWQLDVADFVVDAQGPRLENHKTYRPGNGDFYEAHGFSPDGSKFLFTSDIGAAGPYIYNIFTFDPATQELQNLTKSSKDWNEHAIYSPHGSKIAFMSSQCCAGYDPEKFNLLNLDILQAETYLMSADGSEMMQITHFNTPGYPESQSEHAVAIVSSWRPDGSQLAIAQFLVGRSFDKVEARKLWIVTFEGECG